MERPRPSQDAVPEGAVQKGSRQDANLEGLGLVGLEGGRTDDGSQKMSEEWTVLLSVV